MARVHRNIEIKAPVNKVYACIEDPKTFPEWVTNMIEVKDLTGSGVGTHYNWTWKMVGMGFNGEATFTEDVPNKRIVLKSKGGITSTWTYTFEPHGDVTTLDVDVDYTVPVPVLGKLAEKLIFKRNDRDLEMALMNLKDRLEA
jgi:uncharacterized membrane protein